MAYVLGFFAADGYITVNKRGGQFWCIQITDKRLLESIKKIIRAEHRIGIRPGKENEKTLYRLQIGSIEMCNDLRKIGFFERKTKNLAVPYVPPKYFFHFVRGYFDGDGNVWMGLTNKKRQRPTMTVVTMFTSCSLEFLKQLHEAFRIFGVTGGSIYLSKGNYSRLQFSTLDSLKLYDFMYNQCDHREVFPFLKRKRKVFEKYLVYRKNAAVV